MRTVKSLIEELRKFPEDAECYAYEGEAFGVVIQRKGYLDQGFVHCSGYRDHEDQATELLPPIEQARPRQ